MTRRWTHLTLPLLLVAPGCSLRDKLWMPSFRSNDPVVIRAGITSAAPAEMSPELAAAHEKFRAGDFSAAESAYHRVAENTKNPPPVAEEARFFEAECLYKQDAWPKACDTYHKMLQDFPGGSYRTQACRRMFDIANYWLNDVREEMNAKKEQADGKRWLTITPVVHFEKQKPFLDLEGRAFQALERVHLNDITGPLADKSLFLAGGVKFYREDYKEADYYFTQLVEQHPNSELAEKAIELAIISKHMSTGGPDYDGRKVAEARNLVDTAIRAYPGLAHQKSDFLGRQLASISYQQAEKEYNAAGFYRRTGHPGSAYYCYEIVRRTYPNTKFAALATERMMEIRAEVEAGKFDRKETDLFQNMLNQVESLIGGKTDGPIPPPPPSPGMSPMPANAPRP